MPIEFTVGDILRSDAECLVNTVNCEGYMGKGIAYQFKLAFPANNDDYAKACKTGKLRPGVMHTFRERDKLIVNFPTKDKWRANSKLEYIEAGLEALFKVASAENVKSIAIPPLGCGNGGLSWATVKPLIVEWFNGLDCRVIIYEPSPGGRKKLAPSKQPRLSASHFVLLLIRDKLKADRVSPLRLQKACYFLNLYHQKPYFSFKAHKLGPYCHAIDILSADIKEFQAYHGVKGEDTIQLLERTLASASVKQLVTDLKPSIVRSTELANTLSDHQLELLSTICFLLSGSPGLDEAEVKSLIANWSKEKGSKFSPEQISDCLGWSVKQGLLDVDMVGGYRLNFSSVGAVGFAKGLANPNAFKSTGTSLPKLKRVPGKTGPRPPSAP